MYLLLSHIKVFIFRKPKNESDYRHVYYPTKHDEKELTASLILIPRTKRTVKSWTSILSHVKVFIFPKAKNESDHRHVYYPTKRDEKESTALLMLSPRAKSSAKSWTSILSHIKVFIFQKCVSK